MDFLTQPIPVPFWVLATVGFLNINLGIIIILIKAPSGFEDKNGFHTYQDAYEFLNDLYNDLLEANKRIIQENKTLQDTITELNKLLDIQNEQVEILDKLPLPSEASERINVGLK